MRLTLDKTKTVKIPNDPDNGFVIIRKLSKDELDKAESKSVVINIVGANSGVTVDPYEKENIVASKCLKGWGGLFDTNGEPLKFNQVGVEKSKNFSINIDGEKIRFFKWICEEHNIFVAEVEKEEEEARGN